MTEGSYVVSNYFEKLRHKAREVDDGINGLAEIWKTPHLLIGGYAERTAKTDAYLEELCQSIQSTNVAVEKLRSELEPSLEEIDQLLEECQAMCKDLKIKCDNMDTVLAEYGYHDKEDNNSMQENCHQNSSEARTGDSISEQDKEIPNVEVEFTPNLTWKCKAGSKESDAFASSQKISPVNCIATPVIRSLASVLQIEAPSDEGLLVTTPIRESSYTKSYLKKMQKK